MNFIEKGKRLLAQERYGLAIEKFKEAIDSVSDSDEAHFELGKIYYIQEQYKNAIGKLKKALELNDSNINAHLLLAKSYRMSKKYDLSVEEFNKSLDLGYTGDDIHMELGLTYIALENDEAALLEFQKSLKCNYENSDGHIQLSLLYEKTEEFKKAEHEIQEALKSDPDNAELHIRLARLFEKNKEYGSAIKELEKAIKTGGDNTDINKNLDELYEEKSNLHYQIGRDYRRKGKCDPAVKEFEKALEVSPRKNEQFYKNKILNEIEISQKRVVLKSKPRRLGITITSRCNIRCYFCGGWKMNWDIPERAVQEIIDYYPYLQFMYWLGGEVFLSPYFRKLFDVATTYPNVTQYIATNGLAYDEEWAGRMVQAKLCLSHSIDGINKESYEKIRTGGKFEELLSNIKALNVLRERSDNKDFSTGMSFILMKSNYKELDRVVDFAKKCDFSFLSIMQIQYVEGRESIFLNKDEEALRYIEKVMPKVIQKANEYGIRLFNWLPRIENFVFRPEDSSDCTFEDNKDNPARCLPEATYNNPDSDKGSGKEHLEHLDKRILQAEIEANGEIENEWLCYLPWQRIFIEGSGKAKVESYCRKEIGNIDKNSLDKIWNSKTMQLYRKKMIENAYHDLCDKRCIDGIIPREELRGFTGDEED